jgi:hypothetical protein
MGRRRRWRTRARWTGNRWPGGALWTGRRWPGVQRALVGAAVVALLAPGGVLVLPAPAGAVTSLAASGCPLFPHDNVWHADVSRLPRQPRSAAWIRSMGSSAGLHADFGSGTWDGGPIGIPYVVVPASQPRVPVRFTYASESDPGPYPIPPDVPIEGGPQASGDRHVLVVQSGTCRLYELFDAHPDGAGWQAGSGAVYDLRANRLRPAGWTSADAAGLPILAGLVRYEEVAAGHVDHAIRVTVDRSQASYLWPARHQAGQAGADLPPMGLRLRLRSGIDLSSFPTQARVILRAMQTYGLIVADNGSSGFIGGVPDPRWDNDALHQLGRITLADFEAVDESSLRVSADSAAYRGGVASAPVRRPAAARRPAATTPRALVPHRPMRAEPEVVAGPLAGTATGSPIGAAGLGAAAPAVAKDTVLGLPRSIVVGIALALVTVAALVLIVRTRVAAVSRRTGRHARPRAHARRAQARH